MRFLLTLLLLPLSVSAACRLDGPKLQEQLFTQVRTLYALEPEREVQLIPRISDNTIPKGQEVALLEFISEDRIFDQPPRSQNACPDRIIRLYKVYNHDEFRRCNGILRAEIRSGIYDLIYSNCGAN